MGTPYSRRHGLWRRLVAALGTITIVAWLFPIPVQAMDEPGWWRSSKAGREEPWQDR